MMDFSEFWGIAVFILVMITVSNITKKKRMDKNPKSAPKAAPKSGMQFGASAADFAHGPVSVANRKPAKVKAAKKFTLFESAGSDRVTDPVDDWLSGQLKDERRAYRETSAMFDLKLSHSMNCAAGDLRNTHRRSCDAERLKTASGN